MRRFSPEEKEIIREWYPLGGTALCVAKCPSLAEFEYNSVPAKAWQMGLKVNEEAKAEINRQSGAKRRGYSRKPVNKPSPAGAPSGWGYA